MVAGKSEGRSSESSRRVSRISCGSCRIEPAADVSRAIDIKKNPSRSAVLCFDDA